MDKPENDEHDRFSWPQGDPLEWVVGGVLGALLWFWRMITGRATLWQFLRALWVLLFVAVALVLVIALADHALRP